MGPGVTREVLVLPEDHEGGGMRWLRRLVPSSYELSESLAMVNLASVMVRVMAPEMGIWVVWDQAVVVGGQAVYPCWLCVVYIWKLDL